MQYIGLAADYDGTLAKDGVVSAETIQALTRWRETGRYLLMVTGRELHDLSRVFDATKIFHRIVAENGAVIFDPQEERFTLSGMKPPEEFIEELRKRGVSPISLGHIIVATWTPHENTVLETIRDLGLEMQVIFNKGAVMILPSGVNKASGLQLALQELGLSLQNIAGIGDAENDHAFLNIVGFSAATSNALDSLKKNVNFVTSASHGAGVRELIEKLLAED